MEKFHAEQPTYRSQRELDPENHENMKADVSSSESENEDEKEKKSSKKDRNIEYKPLVPGQNPNNLVDSKNLDKEMSQVSENLITNPGAEQYKKDKGNLVVSEHSVTGIRYSTKHMNKEERSDEEKMGNSPDRESRRQVGSKTSNRLLNDSEIEGLEKGLMSRESERKK